MTQIQVLICLRCFSKYCPLLGWRSLQNRTEKAGIKIHKQVFDEIDLSIEAVDSAGWSRWFLHSEEIYWFKDSRDSLFDLPLSFFCFVLILTPTDHFKKKQRQKKKVWHCRCCWVDWDGDWNNHRDVAKSSCFLLRSILVFLLSLLHLVLSSGWGHRPPDDGVIAPDAKTISSIVAWTDHRPFSTVCVLLWDTGVCHPTTTKATGTESLLFFCLFFWSLKCHVHRFSVP